MRLIYLINVDWFFVSHFLHLARRARREGWQVVVATHVQSSRGVLEQEGVEIVALPPSRSGLAPRGLSGAVGVVGDELRRSPDAIVHAFGLYGIAVATLAGRRAGSHKRVLTITGRGYSAVSTSWRAKLLRQLNTPLCRMLADGPSTRWIAENREDLEACGLAGATAEGRTRVVGGAGVDVARFAPTPMAAQPPLRVAVVARMIWSKGIDIAVEAVKRARARGAEVELTLAGPLDAANPRSLGQEQMARLAAVPGVTWLGRVDDIAGLWATHHVGLLASRGGEGVPKSLIEACACGRPIVTTDVPGCRDLAVATGGIVVPADDAAALAQALEQLAQARTDLAAMGARARAAVLQGYTEEAVAEVAMAFYRELQGAP